MSSYNRKNPKYTSCR